jgi:gamma-glutamylcyclotransferase (GGCT)/AIG2-like uncharacterized protein YtfP
MSLLPNHKNLGHVVDAIVHFNRARDITGSSAVEVARILFDGLNKLQTQWVLDRSEQNLGEVKAFQSMILDSLHGEARSDLLRSNELRSVVAFEPNILNHDILRHRRYRPGSDIEPSLFREASEVHRRLTNAFSELDGGDAATEDRVIKRTAELLYIVRSKLAHGEKTPSGPDLAKRDRDEAVCTVITPLQEILIDGLLCDPSRKLVVYSTLAPGQPNHQVVEGIDGTWTRSVVRGSVRRQLGFPVFTWNPSGPEVNAHLLTSADLPKWWLRIDAFEGPGYKRHLIPTTSNGEVIVANVYVGNQRR